MSRQKGVVEKTKSKRKTKASSSKSSDSKRKNSRKSNVKRSRENGFFSEFPIGIKFLIFFSIANAFLFIILALKFPYLVYFGFNLEGIGARLILMFSALMYFLIIVGFVLKKKWSVFLSVFWYFINIVSSFFSLIFIDKSMFGLLYDFVFYGLVFSTVLNIFVIWYIFAKREFFFDSRMKSSFIDKLFVNILSGFLIVSFLLSVVLFFSLISKSSVMVSEYGSDMLSFSSVDEAFNYCVGVSDTDLCILVFSVLRQDKIAPTDLVAACEKIKSPFYRYTCFEGLSVR